MQPALWHPPLDAGMLLLLLLLVLLLLLASALDRQTLVEMSAQKRKSNEAVGQSKKLAHISGQWIPCHPRANRTQASMGYAKHWELNALSPRYHQWLKQVFLPVNISCSEPTRARWTTTRTLYTILGPPAHGRSVLVQSDLRWPLGYFITT